MLLVEVLYFYYTYYVFSTVSVVIDSGSRYEAAYPSGVSHFLEKVAFAVYSTYSS